jgi:hypothetical protein
VGAEERDGGYALGEFEEARWWIERKEQMKNAFDESGNSPPKVSENGAPIQTGRGLEETKRRIMEAFEKARQPGPVEPILPPHAAYDEHHATRFREGSNRLALRALESSHIMKHNRSGVWEIEAPQKTVEELIAETREEYAPKIFAARKQKGSKG